MWTPAKDDTYFLSQSGREMTRYNSMGEKHTYMIGDIVMNQEAKDFFLMTGLNSLYLGIQSILKQQR